MQADPCAATGALLPRRNVADNLPVPAMVQNGPQKPPAWVGNPGGA
jgi:hypothetical protein